MTDLLIKRCLKRSISGMIGGAASLTAAAALFGSSAYGQTVAEIQAQLRELGAQGGPGLRVAVQDLYRDHHERSDPGGIEITRDLRYGLHPQQTLDVYAPAERGDELLPIVIFVHGGLLGNGDKLASGAEEHLYGNVASFFAQNGFVGVNANYRLVPDVVWPQGAEDIREILGWLRTENGAFHGGDRDAMFMIGQTGSGRHIASFLFHRISQMVRSVELKGAVLVSPLLGPSDSETFRLYYGGDPAAQERYSPLSLIESYTMERSRVPILFLTSEFDPPDIEVSVAGVFAAICEKYGECPRLEQLRNHNRFSAVASFNTPDETVSSVVLEFFREVYESLQSQ